MRRLYCVLLYLVVFQCCDGCFVLNCTVTQPTTCSDEAPWCQTINREQCYVGNVASTCCRTCEGYKIVPVKGRLLLVYPRHHYHLQCVTVLEYYYYFPVVENFNKIYFKVHKKVQNRSRNNEFRKSKQVSCLY